MTNLNQQAQNLQTDEQKQALASLREKDAVRLATLRRNRIAEGFAFALAVRRSEDSVWTETISQKAVSLADELIAELDK